MSTFVAPDNFSPKFMPPETDAYMRRCRQWFGIIRGYASVTDDLLNIFLLGILECSASSFRDATKFMKWKGGRL
ncbi:MAG TPA: hypothetical protein DCY62_09155 [Thalassospira sp.]|nr:hypothetical protein [Thalassospira sp.]